MRVFFAVALAVAPCVSTADAEPVASPTFYKDVLPIMQENCQLCHRAKGANFGGMVAPMALERYEEVRPWAKAIRRVVETGAMPPWSAAPEHHGVFRNERTLTDDEAATLVAWVEQGAKRGRPTDAPEPMDWPETENGWMIGEPDLVFSMPEPFFVNDDVEDLYVDFYSTFSEEDLPNDRWIKAAEFRAGSSAVHHIIARPVGGMAPGYDPVVYDDGVSVKLEKGTTVKWNMHYHKEPGDGTGVWDQSEAGIVFYPEGATINHVITTESLGAFDFVIPANDPNYMHQTTFTFSEEALILTLNPHMHLRGSSAHYLAKYPDGTEEVLLSVPEYDFNWQTTYQFDEPKYVPEGTVIQFTTTWDNSADNPANPDPSQTITWGRPTTDEMMFGWMKYTHVDPRPQVVGEGTASD